MSSFIKIGSGVFFPLWVRICLFPVLSAIAYITGWGYHPTCDCVHYTELVTSATADDIALVCKIK